MWCKCYSTFCAKRKAETRAFCSPPVLESELLLYFLADTVRLLCSGLIGRIVSFASLSSLYFAIIVPFHSTISFVYCEECMVELMGDRVSSLRRQLFPEDWMILQEVKKYGKVDQLRQEMGLDENGRYAHMSSVCRRVCSTGRSVLTLLVIYS